MLYYDTLNSEEQISYLIKPIIEVLQEAGAQLDSVQKSEIESVKKMNILLSLSRKSIFPVKQEISNKKFDFKFNFATKDWL